MQNINQPEAAVAKLYNDYYQPILGHLTRLTGNREVAEDLCQETFVKALKSWATHGPQTNARAWLYRIASNTAYDYLRRQKTIAFLPLLDDGEGTDSLHAPEHDNEQSEGVRAALADIPAHYRVPLVMFACDGYEVREIAQKLGVTAQAVKMRLFRARQQFRRVYVAA